ncbi:MAG: type II secretion system F family protein [Devosiaceae bacterium]|nr:type II secretion system F family protein [Devosiaceae bacterium]
MTNIVELFTNADSLMSILAAIAVAAIIFTIGAQLADKIELKSRVKHVANERERMRIAEMERLRNSEGKRSSARSDINSKKYMETIVEKFSLKKAFVDENTKLKLTQAGYRSKSSMTTFLFFRFVTPIILFFVVFAYLALVMMSEEPLYMSVLYAFAAALVGSYLPVILLKNTITKRQQSIKKAWPDCLDLLLLCVESGMSIELSFKRVGKEMGQQSAELSEELTLTNAELSFLEERGQAFKNLGLRTGLDAVSAVMTALIQADKYGTSIGQSLRIMAEEGRNDRMMAAEQKAASLPPKLTVPLILFFLPVLFIVIMAPAMLQIFGPGGIIG